MKSSPEKIRETSPRKPAAEIEGNNFVDQPDFSPSANIQMQEEEEEMVQPKMQPYQMQEMPEEEEALQGKMQAFQMQEEEEEMVQPKMQPYQMQEIPEDEETLQGKMQPYQMQEEEELMLKESKNTTVQQKSESANKTSLPAPVQEKMESSFGADFSGVNIYSNSTKASNMGAQAYAQGNDIHFAQGKFDPNTQSGQELLGHELTHIVQQREGRVQPTAQKKGKNINDDRSLESEADTMGKQAAKGQSVQMKSSKKKQ